MPIAQAHERRGQRLWVNPLHQAFRGSKKRSDTALMQVHALVVTPHLLNATIDRCWFEVLAMDESLLGTLGDAHPSEHSHIVG
jgi:hypothetical protein